MRISDWISDVCSSDLTRVGLSRHHFRGRTCSAVCSDKRSPPKSSLALWPFSATRRAWPVAGTRSYLLAQQTGEDRKSVVLGKSVSVRVDLGGRSSIKNITKYNDTTTSTE